MLTLEKISQLHIISHELCLYGSVYDKMCRILGVQKAILFRLNPFKSLSSNECNLVFLAILLVEFNDNSRLNRRKFISFRNLLESCFYSLENNEKGFVMSQVHFIAYDILGKKPL